VIHEKQQSEAEQARVARDFAKLRQQQARRGGLIEFVRYFWHTLEPPSRDLIEGRSHLDRRATSAEFIVGRFDP
jgi:hypothetical protein